MGRLQSEEVTLLIIDWAGDGAPTLDQDVNFDGHKDGLSRIRWIRMRASGR